MDGMNSNHPTMASTPLQYPYTGSHSQQRRHRIVQADPSPKFKELNDLSSERVGGTVLFATDDWFAPAENLLKNAPPIFKDDLFTEQGKWMDGWETRRKRSAGFDWCVIQLGASGVIHGVQFDTAFFTGNYAPRISVQAAAIDTTFDKRQGERIGRHASREELEEIMKLDPDNWEEIIPMVELAPGTADTKHNFFPVHVYQRWTHLRVNLYPDGGIARLHVYGQVVPDWEKIPRNQLTDLVAMLNGGVCVGYSNVHFGHARNLIRPGRGKVMSDGWETARRLDRPPILREDRKGVLQIPGVEWAEFKLGHPGVIEKLEIDTNHFKGNFPDSCYIEGALDDSDDVTPADGPWKTLLEVTKLSAHKRHFYQGDAIKNIGVVSNIRIIIAPDGGMSRLRLWGYLKVPPKL